MEAMEQTGKKRVSSVASGIRRSVNGQLFAMILCCNLILLLLAAGCWCYLNERDYAGETQVKTLYEQVTRKVERTKLPDGTWRIEYVLNAPGLAETRVDATEPIGLAAVLFGAAFVVELLLMVVMDLVNAIGIRAKLRPFDQLARQAQRLSQAPMDGTSAPYRNDIKSAGRSGATDGSGETIHKETVHTLESAIEHIRPDAPGQRLSTGQSELEGLEEAINALILRMQETYQQQTRFVSDASHELRTPIAVIKGYTDMLARWGRDDEKVLTESIAAIQTETEHMGTLVEQLLFLARGDSGRTQLSYETVQLGDMLSDVYEESRMIHPDHVWRFSAEADLPVRADTAMLKQAVRILVDNAVKYTPPGETIRIRGCQGGQGQLCIEVQDSGMGVSEEEAAHMFERFFRSDPARSSQTGGTGLGLSIAKWIIDRHDGWFEVLSRPEFGTRMTICLPRATLSTGAN